MSAGFPSHHTAGLLTAHQLSCSQQALGEPGWPGEGWGGEGWGGGGFTTSPTVGTSQLTPTPPATASTSTHMEGSTQPPGRNTSTHTGTHTDTHTHTHTHTHARTHTHTHRHAEIPSSAVPWLLKPGMAAAAAGTGRWRFNSGVGEISRGRKEMGC